MNSPAERVGFLATVEAAHPELPKRIASETLMLEQSTVSEPGLWRRG
jgi:hypothetical protein